MGVLLDINFNNILIYIGLAINFNSSNMDFFMGIYGGTILAVAVAVVIMYKITRALINHQEQIAPPKERIKV